MSLQAKSEQRGTSEAGFPAWETRPGSVVVSAHVTRAVQLVVVTDETGNVRVASLVGDTSDQSSRTTPCSPGGCCSMLSGRIKPARSNPAGLTLPSWSAAVGCAGRFTCRDAVDRQTTGSAADS